MHSKPNKPIQTFSIQYLLPAFLIHVISLSHSTHIFYIQAEHLRVSGVHHNTFCIWIVRNGISILKTLSYLHVTLNSSIAPLHHGPSYNVVRYSSKYTDSTSYLFISLYTWLFPHCQITLSSKRRRRHNKERKLQANTPHEDSCSISNKLLAMTCHDNSPRSRRVFS